MTSKLVPYEINVPKGGVCLVGRDPDAASERAGKPFVGVSGRILEDAMTEAGLTRSRVNLLTVSRFRPPANKFEAHPRGRLDDEIRNLHRVLASLEPSIIVALGNEACHALVPEWPDGRDADGLTHRGNIFGATDIEARRGYVFDSPHGAVVATVDPAYVARTWSPWRVLLSQDLQRAKRIASDGLVRPTRDVEIIGSDRDARRAVESLGRFRILGTDIENEPDTSISCIGFAGESGKAYVFPKRHLARASELLGNPDIGTVWINGIYDLFVLRHRNDIKISGRIDDAMVAWHAAYPEIAGAKEDKRKHRFTRKSLSFLASLATLDPWWKDYNFETVEEQYILNGRDCGITLDVWDYVMKAVHDIGAEATYEHERRLMWPCVDMLQRGLNVDEKLRRERVEALTHDIDASATKSLEVILPLLEREKNTLESLGVIHLFQETDPTCGCCGHGSKKQAACWSCAGFDRAPTKAMLVETYGEELTSGKSKAECEELMPVCHVCGGAERETRWTFNANSDAQMRTILYDVLKLPKRFNDGSLTVNEAALKSLLGVLPT